MDLVLAKEADLKATGKMLDRVKEAEGVLNGEAFSKVRNNY